MSKQRIVYQEHNLATIMDYFAKGFAAKVVAWEYYVDTNKQKVIYRLFVDDEDPTP